MLLKIKPLKTRNPDHGRTTAVDYWEPARKKILSDPHFLYKIRDLDNLAKSSVLLNVQLLEKIEHGYLTNPIFSRQKVTNCCLAAAGLYDWLVRKVQITRGMMNETEV